MKLLVLGATGGTGRQVVAQALDAGHDMTVFIRNRAKLGVQQPRLRFLDGDVTGDRAALGEAMRGQDAVVSALGRGYSFKSEQLIQRSVPGILSAMHASGVRRLVFTSALGVGDSKQDAPFLAKLFFSTLLRGIYADKLAGDNLIRASGLDWTIAQPTQLNDGPLTRKYRCGERLALIGMPAISRADAAHFILSQIGDPAAFGKTLLVSH